MRQPRGRRILRVARDSAVATVVLATLAGCASPGPPLPPTLNLPEIPAVSSLSAERIGNSVIVRWATPERTTDHLAIKGEIEAEVCREVVSGSPGTQRAEAPKVQPQSATAANSAVKTTASTKPCSPVVAKASAQSGASGEAVDALPVNLASGSSQLMAYRVQLKNPAGRTAGASTEVFAVSGDGPPAPAGFHVRATKAGVVLEWTPEPGPSDAVELERVTIEPNATVGRKQAAPSASAGLLHSSAAPAQIRLRAGDSGGDPGGTIDRSAEIAHTYEYTAQRVRTVTLDGREFKLRSAPSTSQTVKVEDVFAPDAPHGLVTAPGIAGEGAEARPVIDLSWEPNAEPRIAGYRVYRRDASDGSANGWLRIGGTELLTITAFHDTNVVSGRRYAYRVTAVGANGMESALGSEVSDTAATP